MAPKARGQRRGRDVAQREPRQQRGGRNEDRAPWGGEDRATAQSEWFFMSQFNKESETPIPGASSLKVGWRSQS